MQKKHLHSTWTKSVLKLSVAVIGFLLLSGSAHATQLHASLEGIVTHQIGHLFFLFSMVVLMFTISGKGLNKQQGWRLIQYSAAFFILWNIDALLAHFLDNQIRVVKLENVSLDKIRVVTTHGSSVLAWMYYGLKLDHLLCVPAMLLLYKGLASLVQAQQKMVPKDTP